ncbi:molybdate transport system substrate-binding protein [Octadecabacter temperatus]|uniref:Molybdate-binding periplasmic protein n=2 Tax=Octadecabacter temperatus TaxID=1458307 RepID=A0A0K0Y304_9RHOB|nr:Molybdate-binding periplasmic protein precursor [Octadecabacter temperatus]SIN90717.1 molybdate transport system substrate-binding protein [Octadecabacter temperatus]
MLNHISNLLQRFEGIKGRHLATCVAIWVSAVQIVQAETLTVFAASSLRDALGEIATDFETQSGDDVVLVFAASSAVARQVAQGAPADAVLLADKDWADWLLAEGAVTEVSPFATNRLVVVGREDTSIAGMADLVANLGDSRIAMAQVEAVPAGRYGKAALITHGVWRTVEPQVVQAANVRAALRFVERGDARFGIGYASDLVALPTLSELYSFAPDTHPKIVYSGAQVTPAGASFMAYIQSVEAQNSLALWGFEALEIQQ